MAPGENTEPREVVQTTPRDLHPTSDIRFVMVEIARLTTEVKRLMSPVNVPRRQVEELVERDPDRVAQQVRAWMSED